eukprot:m.302438 g.302438  ORF g.302438 m.302438 type:complete len:52 (-) comp15190_c0_seq1:27-182(-)
MTRLWPTSTSLLAPPPAPQSPETTTLILVRSVKPLWTFCVLFCVVLLLFCP